MRFVGLGLLGEVCWVRFVGLVGYVRWVRLGLLGEVCLVG